MPTASLHGDLAQRLDDTVTSMRASRRGVSSAMQATQRHACLWFVECLYQAFCCMPRALVALPRKVEAYTKGRSGAMPFGYDVVTRIVEAAIRLDWLRVLPGSNSAAAGHVTRVHAAGELLVRFEAEGIRWQHLDPPPREGLIVVATQERGKGRRTAGREDGAHVAAMQDNLYRINEFLLSQCICLNCSDDTLLDPVAGVFGMGRSKHSREAGQAGEGEAAVRTINLQAVAMRRIFARGRLDLGGRFYGGWWQFIPSEYRQRIIVNGWLTVECDFSGMALACLYAREGAVMPEGDPYDIGLAYTGPDDPRRKIVKQYLNALLNDTSGGYRISPAKLQQLGLTSEAFRGRLYKRHSAIRHMLRSGVGLELQFVDSRIAENVMLRFVEMGEVCLPVHDSFLVRRGMEATLRKVMYEEFRRVTGSVTAGIQATLFDSSAGIGVLADSIRPTPSMQGIEAAMQMAADHLRSYSIALGYLNDWREQCIDEGQRRREDLAIDEALDAMKCRRTNRG